MERYSFCKKIPYNGHTVFFNRKKTGHAILTALLFFSVGLIFQYSGNNELVLLTYSNKSVTGQLYEHQRGDKEKVVSSSLVKLKKQSYQTFRIPIGTSVDGIDSFSLFLKSEPNNELSLHYLLFKRRGYLPIEIPLNTLRFNDQVTDYKLTNILHLTTLGENPVIFFDRPLKQAQIDWLSIYRIFLVSLFLSFSTIYFPFFLKKHSIDRTSLLISIPFVAVAVLAFLMATKADFNTSPDERDHFMAADYYKTHTKTPERNIETGVYTYNDLWNYSRVYLKGFDYFLAGKVSNLFDGKVESYISVRFWGIVMLILFALIAVLFPRQSLILLPLLLTPQVWYIFSYVNDGSMPLLLSILLLVVTEVGKPELLNKKLDSLLMLFLLLIGGLLGVLFLSKDNYYLFAIFYLFYLFTLPLNFSLSIKKGISDYIRAMRSYLKKPLLIIVIALFVVFAKELTIERQTLPLSNETSAYYTQIKSNFDHHIATGISGEARFGSYYLMLPAWMSTTSRSFITSFGYMKHWGSDFFYWFYYTMYFLLIAGSFYIVVKRREFESLFWWCIGFIFVLGMIFASSFIYSYEYDYQAQGKYLFPILPILGFVLYKLKANSDSPFSRLLMLVASALFLAGIYSFVFIGIASINL